MNRLAATTALLSLCIGCYAEVGPAPSRQTESQYPPATFKFRGYDEYSDCAEIVRAEEGNGSEITAVEIWADDLPPDIHVTTMRVYVHGVEMQAEIRCHMDGDLLHAIYWIEGTDADTLSAKFQTISAGLSETFGPPKVVEQPGGVSHTFVCNEVAELYLADGFRPTLSEPFVMMTVDLLRGECLLPPDERGE